ncbi:MAG: LysE family transporter [Coriobacteriia bacterium]|nr:LysE family transporter [Coriobacteriia bacterium]
MSPLLVFVRALGIGFMVAAPVGAISVLCIQRTLARGRSSGYATGAGVATADALYAAIAAFGLTAITGALVQAAPWVRLIGGIALVYLGVRAMLSRPGGGAEAEDSSSHGVQYSSAVALTLANPQTIVTFAAVFASIGLTVAGGGWSAPVLTVAGVFCGSMAWWIVLVTGAAMLRGRANDRVLLWVNRVSGAAIAVFGVLAAWAGAVTLLG